MHSDAWLHDAFRMTVSRTGTTPTPFGFAGAVQYQSDGDSGLMLLGNRYYDPSIGRFIASDPVQDGDNWYAYCGNGPLGGVDPEGLEDLIIVVRPGGVGQGAHATIGIPWPGGGTWWVGFFPLHGPGGGSSPGAGISGSVPGDIRLGDFPRRDWRDGTYVIVPVTPGVARDIRRRVGRQVVNPPPYSLDRHNCSTWVAEILAGLDDNGGQPILGVSPGDIRTPCNWSAP